ncbi:MAG TPA: ABC transporter permease [Terracidiphilus sp.]|jgi:predicted permease|nr:ABC transporter permease [Terracidiphilus sp.]
MGKLRMLWARVMGQAAQGREDDAFDAEIREHIDLLEKRFMAQGMSARDAARAARRQFGNVTALKEKQRAQRGILSPTEWWRDARFGLRMLAKRPASNAAVVLALALGIGMNSAVFTFVNGILLRPPQGVSQTRKMVELWLKRPKQTGPQGYLPFNYPDYVYYRDHAKSVEGLLAFDGDGVDVIWNHAGSGQNLNVVAASGNFFSLLGINAAMGRMLSVDDDRIENPRQVVVLSYACWKNKMGADPGIVGRTLMLNGEAFTVVGVAPAKFTGLMVATETDMWAPLTAQESFTHDKGRLTDHNTSWLIVTGKMRSAGDRKSVQAEMHVLAKQVGLAHPEEDEVTDAEVYAMTLMPGPYRGYVFAFTGLLMIVFVLVLLIACTNAASLMLARATGRVREMATRAALGAGRARLVRQMLVESLMLAGVAGGAGVAIAWAASRLFMQLKPGNLPIALDIPMDWRVVLFTLAVSVATGVVFGLAPALRASAVEAARVLREESQTAGRKKARLRNVLVVAQMAMCVVLLAGASLCVRSLMNANAIDPGFDTRHIALAALDPGSLGYTPQKVTDFYTRLLERVKRLPGVTSASYAAFLPLGTQRQVTKAGKLLGNDPNAVRTDQFRVEPGLLGTMGIPLLRGRDLTQKEADSGTPDGVVINEYLAQRLWPGEDPLGKRLALSGEKTTSEVVGVVKNGKYRTLGEGSTAAVFRGTLPAPRTLVVRTSGDERVVLEEVRRTVPAVDPLMTTTLVQTIGEFMTLPLFPARATGWMLGVSGILAVVMTAIGLFGVIAYVVSQRTHEIGVRMALGARRSDVLKMVMGQGLRLTAIGLGIGLCAAFGAARLLSPLLYGIKADDPATMAAVAVSLAAIALTACYLPARKAMRVEPSVALRYE